MYLKKHQTFFYIFHRIKNIFFNFILNFIFKYRPWIVEGAFFYLNRNISKKHFGLEIGSGYGTVYFAKKSKRLISIETDQYWFLKIKKILIEEHLIKKVSLQLFKIQNNLQIKKYIEFIKKFKNETFDYVIIDGKFRAETCKVAIPKVKRGGMLIIDNVNRYLPSRSKSPSSTRKFQSKMWRDNYKKIKDWKCLIYSNNITDTAIFIKKKNDKR